MHLFHFSNSFLLENFLKSFSSSFLLIMMKKYNQGGKKPEHSYLSTSGLVGMREK